MARAPPARTIYHSSASANADDDDDDYFPESETDRNEPDAPRPYRHYTQKALTRKQRALCRKLYRRKCTMQDLISMFHVSRPTITRVAHNRYSSPGADNLDSDKEYVQEDDVSQALNQLRRLPRRGRSPLPQVAQQSRQRPDRSISAPEPRPPTTRSSQTKHNKQVRAAVGSSGEQLFRFLVDIRFSEDQISAILPRLRNAGITDDETFTQFIALPDRDIQQLLKELEEKKHLTMFQRILIRSRILEQRGEAVL